MDIITAYRQGLLEGLLPYQSQDRDYWFQRQDYLARTYNPDKEMLDWLRTLNQGYGCNPAALQSIECLESGGLAVVSGQQAGLLTGPLYTIYKIITSITMAEALSNKLNSPVIPVFWLASEDHDFEEIKSVRYPVHEKPETIVFPGEYNLTPASQISVTSDDVGVVLERLRAILPATEFTEDLLAMVSDTGAYDQFSDWCGSLISRLFSHRGLVVIDASGAPLRKAAHPIFRFAISKGEEIHALLAEQAEKLAGLGCKPGLDVPQNHSHLFWTAQGQRIALLRDGERFVGRRNEISFSLEQIIAEIDSDPTQFSPNVVLRPLVQELALPVLAMVGGPGEFAYLPQLEPVFSLFSLIMPPLVPRLSGTLVEPPIARLLDKYSLTVSDVQSGLQQWLEEQMAVSDPIDIDTTFTKLRQQIVAAYDDLKVERLESELGKLKQKNLNKVLEQVQYLQNRTEETHRRQNKLLHQHLRRLEVGLPPEQERVYNIFWYLNKYGPDLIDLLLAQDPDKSMELWL